MAKRKCPACAEPIEAAASKCKHCGSAVTPVPSKGVSPGLVVLAIGGTLVYSYYRATANDGAVGREARQAAEAKTAAPGAPIAPRVVPPLTAAVALVKAYDKNEVAADNEYKGKVLRIAGKIRNIGKDITDDPYLTMGEAFKGVNCYFDSKHADVIAKISKGDSYILEGKCSGLTIGSVILRDCRIPSDAELRADHPDVFKQADVELAAEGATKKPRAKKAASEGE